MTILEGHLDTFGHVNNASYLEILEEARWDLITRNGYGLDAVRRLGIGPVVLEAHLRFVRELHNPGVGEGAGAAARGSRDGGQSPRARRS